MIWGITSGDTTTAVSMSFPQNRPRTKPNEANVPRTVESSIVMPGDLKTQKHGTAPIAVGKEFDIPFQRKIAGRNLEVLSLAERHWYDNQNRKDHQNDDQNSGHAGHGVKAICMGAAANFFHTTPNRHTAMPPENGCHVFKHGCPARCRVIAPPISCPGRSSPR